MEFSDIALAKFLQTAPELNPLIVVFKDVTEELINESDIQVGIFVLRSGDDVLYVPVISKGDGVYPIDSIFISSKNKFFPLTKNTIEKILNTQKPSMGQAKKIPDTVSTNPSVHHLVNPPRTGKFAYASASRLTEFLSSIPTDLKTQVLEKISSDSNVYNRLHDMFDLKALFGALKTRSLENADQPADRSIGVRIITGGDNLPTPQITSILTNGYAVDGSNPLTRVAIASEWWTDKRFTGLTDLEAGRDYDVVMKNGSIRQAFVPVQKTIETMSAPDDGSGYSDRSTGKDNAKCQFILFSNGDYAINTGAVIVGEPKDGHNVIRNLFGLRPPVVLKNVNGGDRIAIFGDNMDLVGVYRVNSVAQTYAGCTIKAYDEINSHSITIQGLRGYGRHPISTYVEIFVPMSSLVIVLGERQADLEQTVNAASVRREMLEWAMLNTSMNLTHDGVEFSVNGRPMGKEAEVMELLVCKEGIDPAVAENFVKQAKEKRKLTVYLSKRADFEPGEIPQFGNQPPKQINQLGTQQDYLPMSKLQQGMDTGDSQTVESVVISELLQSPDMKEHVMEYLPDIEEAIDKLGRIMLLARLHINRLGEGFEADKVFELLSSIKNVYKMLGENYLKLENLVNTIEEGQPVK